MSLRVKRVISGGLRRNKGTAISGSQPADVPLHPAAAPPPPPLFSETPKASSENSEFAPEKDATLAKQRKIPPRPPPAIIDRRLAPTWWAACFREDETMTRVLSALLDEYTRAIENALTSLPSFPGSPEEIADSLCRAATRVSGKTILALERSAGPLATAMVLAMIPNGQPTQAWCETCFGAWRSRVTVQYDEVGIVEGVTECCWAELLALCTSCEPVSPRRQELTPDPSEDALVLEILRLAFDNTIRVRQSGRISEACRDAAAAQWAAAVGNLTPERADVVLDAFRARCEGLKQLHTTLLGSLLFVRVDLTDASSRRALDETLEMLMTALDWYLASSSSSEAKKQIPDEETALACVRCLETLVRAPENWESVRHGESEQLLRDLDASFAALFKRIDEVWAPRKATTASHPRLTRDLAAALTSLMVTVFVRMPQDSYGANLELFVNKRLQKPAMDKKETPKALINLATFLRGPRWRGYESAARKAPTRWPRVAQNSLWDQQSDSHCKDDEATTRILSAHPSPRTVGGWRSSDHAFACCMPAFSSIPGHIFRPEVLVWIREKTFGIGGHYKCADCAANARLAAQVILAMLANTLTASFVRALLDDVKDLKAGKTIERLERYVVGLRVIVVLLDDRSGFSRHAPSTPANAALPEGGIAQIQTDVRNCFVKAATGQLRRSLEFLANESFSQLNSRGHDTTDCVLDIIDGTSDITEVTDGARYDARRCYGGDGVSEIPVALSAPKMLHLQVIQETCRCVPFVPWTQIGKGLLQAGLLHHGAPCVRRSFRVALQRLLLERPNERTSLICDTFAYAADRLAEGADARILVLKVCAQLLWLWHRVLRDGADGRSQTSVAADADKVLEVNDQEDAWRGWSEQAEATALAFLADDSSSSRDIALDAFDAVFAVRSCQIHIVDMVGATQAVLGEKTEFDVREDSVAAVQRQRASAALSSGHTTIHELLSEDGVEADVAQRAIRAFVDKSNPTSRNGSRSTTWLPKSAPTLRKVSKMSNELWYGALPLLAIAVGNGLEEIRRTAMSYNAQRILYSALCKRHAFKQNPERFEAQLSLLLALQFSDDSNDQLDKFLTGNVWTLIDDAAIESTTSPGGSTTPTIAKSTSERLRSSCRASSTKAARPVVASLLAWLQDAEDKKRATPVFRLARRSVVWALLRAIVESTNFKKAAATDRRLVSTLAGACVLEAFLDPSTTSSNSVVDRTFLIDAVATAIYDAAVCPVKKPEGSSRIWATSELSGLYAFLRATHIWPRPGGPLETNWHVTPAKTALAASHDNQPCTTNKGVPDADGFCLTVAGRAVAKLLAMGTFLPDSTVDGLLDEKSPPVDLTWFLTAEKLGPTARCLPWLLSHHTETLADAFVRRAVSAPKEGSLPFFHAIADQILPAASIPLPPTRSADLDATSAYYASVVRFGLDSDLAQLELVSDSEEASARPPAVAVASVFDDDRFVSGKPERLGACSILLFGLRAIRDRDVSVRLRAYLLVRAVTLHLLDKAPQGVRSLAATRSGFVQLMSSYWVTFSSECSSRRDAEANAILECVATCVGAAGYVTVHNILAEIFGPHTRNREEWGGAATTARILGALCKHVILSEGEGLEASARGVEILTWLVHFCSTYSTDAEQLWSALCSPGGRGGVRNVTAIILYLRGIVALPENNRATTLAVCQRATLACYGADGATTARLLVEPLSFEAHERAVDFSRGTVNSMRIREDIRNPTSPTVARDDEDALAEACGSVVLLAGLGGADPTSLLPYLHIIAHFCVIHFASPTSFGGGAQSISAEFTERARIPRLIHTLILNLQPLFLASEAKKTSSAAKRVNSILALLRAGIDAQYLELDWSRPVATLGDPTAGFRNANMDDELVGASLEDSSQRRALDSALSTEAWLDAVPPLHVAAGGGGLASPVALVRALCEVLVDADEEVARRWGSDALRWALRSRDFPTKLKAYVVYLTLGAPRVRESLPVLLDTLTSLHSDLAASRAAEEQPRSSVNKMATTGVTSTAHFQAASCCCGLLRIIGAALFAPGFDVVANDRVFWAADAALRTRCIDDFHCKVYRYGVALLRAFVARNLGNAGSVAVVSGRISSSPLFSPEEELTSSPLLNAAARLAVGILCDDEMTRYDARLAAAPVLARVAPGDAPSKKDSRAVLAVVLVALAPWLTSRAGSYNAVDVADTLAMVAQVGAGDGGYLGSAIRDNLVVSLPPDVPAFRQRCAAWLVNAAAASNVSRTFEHIDVELATASLLQNSSRARTEALSLAAEILRRDEGGLEAATLRAKSMSKVVAVALGEFSNQSERKSSLRQDERIDDNERRAASAVVALVVERLGVAAGLVDQSEFDENDDDSKMKFLGCEDTIISNRLRALTSSCGNADLPVAEPVVVKTEGNEPPPPSRTSSQRFLRDDPRWAAYAPLRALVARGVPLGAVRLRAQAEGLDPELLQLDPSKGEEDDNFNTSQAPPLTPYGGHQVIPKRTSSNKPPPPPKRPVSHQILRPPPPPPLR